MIDVDIKHRFPGLKLLIGLAALVVVAFGLREAQSVLVPILFSLFLAILGSPAAVYLRNRGLPKILSVLLVAILLIAGLVGIGYLFYNSLNEFQSALPKYQSKIDKLIYDLEGLLGEYGFEMSTEYFLKQFGTGTIVGFVGSTFKSVVGALSITVVVLIITIFMLYEATDFRKKLAIAMGEAFQEERFEGVATDVQRYLGIKTVTSLITGFVVGLLNYILGVDFWLLWGLLAYVFNYIPFVGSIIAAIPAIILGFIQFGPSTGIILIVAYLLINNGVSNFMEPILMGPRLGLSPMVVFLSLVVWGWLWGPAGMLLSVPLTMILKIFLEHSEEFRWVSILMANRPGRQITESS